MGMRGCDGINPRSICNQMNRRDQLYNIRFMAFSGYVSKSNSYLNLAKKVASRYLYLAVVGTARRLL